MEVKVFTFGETQKKTHTHTQVTHISKKLMMMNKSTTNNVAKTKVIVNLQ